MKDFGGAMNKYSIVFGNKRGLNCELPILQHPSPAGVGLLPKMFKKTTRE